MQTGNAATNNIVQGYTANTDLQSQLVDNLFSTQTDQTNQADKQADVKQAERNQPQDVEQTRTNNQEKAFMRADQDLSAMRQRMFQNLLTNQTKSEQWNDSHHAQQTRDPSGGERAEDPTAKQQTFFRSRGDSQGLQKDYSGAPWKNTTQFKQQMPPGYNAFMQEGPRGKQLFIYTNRHLKGAEQTGEQLSEALMEEGQVEKEEETPQNQKATQGMLASQKKLAKQMGVKEGADEVEENEEIMNAAEEDAEEVEGDQDPALNALRKAMGAKASKAKGKGDGEEGVEEDMPWANFGEAIESHTVLFGDAGHAESANLVSQASFASAVIMGAALHIRLKGARLNYSGTSHHGLPIPSGDESLEIGAKELVSGLERDMGQLGVESVFVNGQRFELANKDDERKLRDLVKDNPDLWQMIENIREAIRDSRYLRTCMGLTQEGPGGRA